MTASEFAPVLGRTVHLCPQEGCFITGCCGKVPFDLPMTDRLTINPALVTCPSYKPPTPAPGVHDAMALQAGVEGARLCALGYHAWMPWLPIRRDDGLVLRYETYCVRCRHPEQFDV